MIFGQRSLRRILILFLILKREVEATERLSSDGMPIDGNEWKDLHGLFATKSDMATISQSLGAINAKLDLIVPRDTHELIWKADAEWKKDIHDDVECLKASRVPSFVITVGITVLGWIVTGIIAFSRTPTH